MPETNNDQSMVTTGDGLGWLGLPHENGALMGFNGI